MRTITANDDLDEMPDGWYIAGERLTTEPRGLMVDAGERVYVWSGWICEDEQGAERLSHSLALD